MITNNYKKLASALLIAAPSNSGNGAVSAKDVDGNTKYMATRMGAGLTSAPVTNIVFGSNKEGIHIGSGNTAPSESDYCLEQRITSGLTASTPTRTFSAEAGNYAKQDYVFTLTNTSGSPITINEIGFVQKCFATDAIGVNTNSGQNSYFLFDRTVLNSPVVIPAGDYAAFRYTLKVDLS